jgi:UrcA family protein
MTHTKTHAIRAITLSAAAALGFYAAGASAGSQNDQFVSDGVNKYIVRFPDLDLSKMEGAASLYVRLQHAAEIACNSLQSRGVGIAEKYRACKQHAVADAVASVNRPLLSQYHVSRTKGGSAGPIQLAQAK